MILFNCMKNYKSSITGSLVALLILISPISIFAESNNKNSNENKMEQVQKKNQNKEQRGNFFKNGFANWFNKRINKVQINTNTNLTPSIEGVTAPTVLKAGEVGTWIVKASDPKNGSLSYAVDWGDKNIVSKTLSLLSTQTFVQTGTFTHTYGDKGEYRIMFTVSNEAGLKTVSSVTVHVTESQNVTAPVLSNINVTDVKSHKATLNWTTDVKSNTMVWISKTSPVDTNLNNYNSRKALVLNHKIEVKNLEANTKYYVIVGSMNTAGTTKSSETSFTTLPVAYSSNPVITSLSGPTTIKTGETATVTVNAYNPNNEALSYSVNWGDVSVINRNVLLEVKEPIFVQTATFSHVYSTVGTYTATFTAENSKGEKTSSSMKIEVTPVVLDTTAPTISAFVIPETATTLAVNITTLTANDANGVTGYKITETATAPLIGDTGWSSTVPTVYTFATAGSKTLYAWTKDAAGNVSTSLNDSVVITLADTTAPIISGITTTITGLNATVTWTTNEPATSNVFYSTGTPVDINNTATTRVSDGTLVTNHSLSIPSLTSSTLYHFIIKSLDSSNNIATSSESTFTTN